MPIRYSILATGLALLVSSCQLRREEPYAPPPRLAAVEDVIVNVHNFAGRPEAIATVTGHLSSSVAQLTDSKQSRSEGALILEVLEQTPRGASPLGDAIEQTPFETQIPIEILGLDPGPHLLRVNGLEVNFELPLPRAEIASNKEGPPPSRITLVEEFIPMKTLPPYVVNLGSSPPADPPEGGHPPDPQNSPQKLLSLPREEPASASE